MTKIIDFYLKISYYIYSPTKGALYMGKRRKKQQQINVKTLLISSVFLATILVIDQIFAKPHSIGFWLRLSLIIIIPTAAGVALYYTKRKKQQALKETLIAMGVNSPMKLSPTDYEKLCALLLEKNGWKTELTKATGDYGADIIASKRGTKIVVQCKQWTDAVGVKAVQEVHSAKELASKLGILLLSHNDLIDLKSL